MKQKRFLSMFALLLMAATGAMAQSGTPSVKKLTVPDTWTGDMTTFSAADLPSDFAAVGDDVVATIPAPTATGNAVLIYGFSGEETKYVEYANGVQSATDSRDFPRDQIYGYVNIMGYEGVYYTAAAPAGYTVSLKDGTEDEGKWTISPTEAAEGATVTATYSGEKKVKSVKAVKKAPAGPVGTDLATITADYEAKDGETLTGTLASNVKISIADGATVTLKDVNINGVNNYSYAWAGITCAGDATITLEGTNTVKGFAEKYPGIFVSSGKTLIINGTGELNASSNGSADNGSGGAGIGGGYEMNCGNIEIQSGTVTATGNQWGAGIGGGYNASCGNITISGGTVTATGGEYGAGIGGGKRGTANVSCGNITISGGTVNATGGADAAGIGGGKGNNNSYKSSCGTIRITTGVTSVTATKGNSNAQSIGAGKYGTCGSVTIEDSSKVTQK